MKSKNILIIVTILLFATVVLIPVANAVDVFQKDEKPFATQARAAAPAAARPAGCNDGNIAGKAVGGVAGGVLASNLGKGNGKPAATIGGTLGGAYIGGEVIPLNNVTCP